MPLQDTSPSPRKIPALYSFRRCPYAMRARMAILASSQEVELRDILLKDKPEEMVQASPKATVPVLITKDGSVLEESLDIMYWALSKSDPENWLPKDPSTRSTITTLIAENDGPFKSALDRYKYHVRFPENSRDTYRAEGEVFLKKLETRLQTTEYLLGNTPTMADIAIFPFVRQFANSDRKWFDAAPYPQLQNWLDKWISSPMFHLIMKKRPVWNNGITGPLFPALNLKDDN